MKDFTMVIGGVALTVAKWPERKKPILTVRFEGESREYKVASFNSGKTAHWFVEIMKEALLKEDEV